MVKILIAIITTAVCTNLAAQDVIYMSNGNTINAVVLKISEELIQFKKEENRDGPIYEKSLKNIDSIRYKNGFVESFTAQLVLNSYLEETTDKIIFNSIDSTSVDEIIIDGIRFFIVKNGDALKTYELVADFAEYRNESVHLVPGGVSFVFESQNKNFTMYTTSIGDKIQIPFRLNSSGSLRRFEKVANHRLMQIRFLTIPLFINIDQEYSDAFNNMFWVHLRSEF